MRPTDRATALKAEKEGYRITVTVNPPERERLIERNMIEEPNIVVFRQKPHGLQVGELVSELRAQVPAQSVQTARTVEEERSMITDADIVVSNSFDEGLLEHAPDLSLFTCSFAGHDHLPLGKFREYDVAVTNAAGVHAPNVAEHAIGGLLTLTRGLLQARRQQRKQEWRNFQVDELAGSTVTVVGIGSIGDAICRRLQGFDVELIGVRHSPEKGGPADRTVGYDEFDSAAARSSAIVLACPLTDRTRHLLDEDSFRTLPSDCAVVNVARGAVIDTDALVDALQSNEIGGATLDVTDPEPLPMGHPLWKFENVLITPHNAGYTPRYYERLAALIAENVEHVMEAGEWDGLRNQVLP